MKAVAIIAVRLESQRLPEKALADIEGLPMFAHTCKRVKLAKTISEVYLATDNDKIKQVAEKLGIPVIMTAKYHTNSTERIAEACDKVDADIIVNVQGDEPLVYPEHVDQVVSLMFEDKNIGAAIGVTKFNKRNSPSDIKAVFDQNWNILYASRNDIPCAYLKPEESMWKMCFIVPFRKPILKKYLEWKATPLELMEDNHFLRLLEHGVKMKAVEINGAKTSVDTAEGLAEIKELMKTDHIKQQYM